MRIAISLVIAGLALSACRGDETISAFAPPETVFALRSLDGTPAAARATIRFPRPGEVTGTGPCNAFSAAQTAPYPWFALGPIRATRRACPELGVEAAYFTALKQATIAEVSGDTLILSDPGGPELVFQADN
ncbi:META domain-containing protein [Maribius pontilimi]|uniref:META domain-containing protein n=1 Tax=Palleronia pontilimi TaxID=1964209 RepID=A0A934IIL7_9RHOB|nr:META domain-containing protein [Palleronia pontilimi]MBJ3763603.1 META domain-containing protein [Palleronia pontilimi]